MTVTYKDYNNALVAFAKKHNAKAECKVYSSMWENNVYHKEYCWSDGAEFCERTELVTETVVAEKHGIQFEVEKQFYKTEFWSTEFGSRFFYEVA